MHVRLCIVSVVLFSAAPTIADDPECADEDRVGSGNRTLRDTICAGVCLDSQECQEALLTLIIRYRKILESAHGERNLTTPAARWIVEAARGVPGADQLLDDVSQNKSAVDASTRVVLLVLYGALIAFGTCGNALVVLSVARKPAMRTVRNLFILNLAVSDTLVCTVVSPLTLLELFSRHWPLPDSQFLCKATGTIQAILIFVSTLSITAIALDRYQLIVYPTRRSLQTMGAVVTVACIWLMAAALASPLFIYRSLKIFEIGFTHVETISFCFENWPIPKGRAHYSLFSLIFQYVLPVLVVVASYARIYINLIGRPIARRNRNRTPAILTAIAVTYVISWLPLNVFNVVADYSSEPILGDREVLITYAVCHMCGMSSACSNPLLYGWLNENFRKEFEEMLCSKKRLEEKKRSKERHHQGDTEMTALAQLDHTSNAKCSLKSQVF